MILRKPNETKCIWIKLKDLGAEEIISAFVPFPHIKERCFRTHNILWPCLNESVFEFLLSGKPKPSSMMSRTTFTIIFLLQSWQPVLTEQRHCAYITYKALSSLFNDQSTYTLIWNTPNSGTVRFLVLSGLCFLCRLSK